MGLQKGEFKNNSGLMVVTVGQGIEKRHFPSLKSLLFRKKRVKQLGDNQSAITKSFIYTHSKV